MSSGTGAPISQHWTGTRIVLSYLISVTGSYCTIQLMEQWRQVEEPAFKRVLLLLSALALGGCGIWCMHFTGMTALELELENGVQLQIDFELGFTALSFMFAVAGVLVGLKIASSDPFFLEIEAERRKQMLAAKLKNVKMNVVVNKSAVTRRIKLLALLSRLWVIMLGGGFAALGVLGMHYLGMMAQRTNADMSFDMGVVAASVIIAFVTANAAFWILFRALTFMPDSEVLRLGSALVMGLAVCATHYCGMGAATYTVSEENYVERTRFVLDGKSAADVASNGALLLCYWLASFGVVRSTRMAERSNYRSARSAIQQAKTSVFKPSAGPQSEGLKQSEVVRQPQMLGGLNSGSVRRVFVSGPIDSPV